MVPLEAIEAASRTREHGYRLPGRREVSSPRPWNDIRLRALESRHRDGRRRTPGSTTAVGTRRLLDDA
jgi:hypothetical protein